MARKKTNPLKLGLKAAKNINVVDNPAAEALDTTVEEPMNVSTEQIADTSSEETVDTSVAENKLPSISKSSATEKSATPASRKTRSKEEARNTTDKLTGFPPQDTVGRKGRGRPPGKKSDPKTTQAGGYVDEDLYLDIQITLTQLKRRFTKRSEVNVSTLMGALFSYFQGLSADEQESFLRKYSEIDNYEE